MTQDQMEKMIDAASTDQMKLKIAEDMLRDREKEINWLLEKIANIVSSAKSKFVKTQTDPNYGSMI